MLIYRHALLVAFVFVASSVIQSFRLLLLFSSGFCAICAGVSAHAAYCLGGSPVAVIQFDPFDDFVASAVFSSILLGFPCLAVEVMRYVLIGAVSVVIATAL